MARLKRKEAVTVSFHYLFVLYGTKMDEPVIGD